MHTNIRRKTKTNNTSTKKKQKKKHKQHNNTYFFFCWRPEHSSSAMICPQTKVTECGLNSHAND